MNYEAWRVRSIGGGSTDSTVNETPCMPIIPRVGIKGGGPRSEHPELWVVEGVEQPELRALVGAGFAPPERMNELAFTPESGLPMSITKEDRGGGPPATLAALRQLEIAPKDIRLVVVQHIHWDFTYFLDYVPQAQAIIQKREILASIDPTPECRFGAPKEGTNLVLKRKQPEYLLIIDGDLEVWPGYFVIGTPGHTDGHQEVIIQTEKGKVDIGSENISSYRHLYPGDSRGYDIPTPDPAPYTFMKDGHIARQHNCGDPIEHDHSINKVLALLTGEGDIVAPHFDQYNPKALPYQWWKLPSEEYKREYKARLAQDEYWDPNRLGKQGIFPEALPFLTIRKERLKKMGKWTGSS